MSRPPLHALQGFLAAAEAGNLSRAAESLHLTVSALSHQVKALEERLGQRLFERGPRGIRLTPDGERLRERIAPHLRAIDAALRPGQAARCDVLRLSLLPSLSTGWLLPRLAGFMARHPEIELSLDADVAPVDFQRAPEVDAAVRFGAGQWPGLTIVKLFDDTLAPVASPALVKARRWKPAQPLSALPLLGDPADRWSRWFTEFGGKAPARYAATILDTESLHRAAAEGIGVALARLTLARPLLDSGRLVRLSRHTLASGLAHYLVYPPRSADHDGLLAFRTWLEQEAAAFRRDTRGT